MLAPTLDALVDVARHSTGAGGYFPAMYARVTDRVIAEAAAGRFGDAARMERFVERFAGRYLAARAEPDRATRCWRGAFAVAGDRSLLIVQHLLLGINAHVNFDLPQTVVALVDEGSTPDSLETDFDAVNAVLAEVFTELVADLGRVSRLSGWAVTAGGGRVFNFSLVAARRQAWRAATRLAALDDAGRRAEVARLDELVAVLAYLVTRPTIPLRWAIPLARRLEERDPRKVTTALLGPLVRR